MNKLSQNIASGFNEKKPASRTTILQFDLSKGFDMVKYETLLNDLFDSSLDRGTICWPSHLRGKQSFFSFLYVNLKFRNVRFGFPQIWSFIAQSLM